MFLNGLYTQRRVPRDRDGRTNEEKAKADYREYRSLWYEIDETKMYSEAKGLRDAGFDCHQCVYSVLMRGMSTWKQMIGTDFITSIPFTSIANMPPKDLKWSVNVNHPPAYGMTMQDKTAGRLWPIPRCTISANLIWPLLVPQYTESEKVGYRLQIAVTMLHELTVSHPQCNDRLGWNTNELIRV